MYSLDSSSEWNCIHNEDLWIYNKLFLSRVLGYTCGPSGIAVPKPDFYIIRPSFNLMGMGRLSRIEWIESITDHLHPSEFWCEVFDGEHLSVDFHNKNPQLIVKGIKKKENSLYRWDKWEKVSRDIEYPDILEKVKGTYDWINCEFIGRNLIEVHFRRNPDFRYGNTITIPVWKDQTIENNSYRYIDDPDYLRKGFYIN